jgi:penicillin-binding protein 1B
MPQSTDGRAGRPGASAPPPLWRRIRWRWVLLALVPLAVLLFVLRPYWKLSSQFEEIIFRQPSRLYAQPVELAAGGFYPRERVLADLRGENYREAEGEGALPVGRYRLTRDGLAVHLRAFPTPAGKGGGGVLEVAYNDRKARILHLRAGGVEIAKAQLEPPLLASYYGPDLLERRPVAADEVAQDLIDAVVAAEDDAFFSHSGVSISGMLRALWVNMRGGQIRQGGSTLTQQLVKNLYLTQQRTLVRKSEELVLALMLELRYSKREILSAYLNEIYLGRSGGVNLMGMGAAARAYFGKDASQLSLGDAATLAGMIRAPAYYSPLVHPERARERRDWVLHRLETLGRGDKRRIAEALAQPASPLPEVVVRRRAPYFADAMAAEAARRFKIEDLPDGGYALFSTLSWADQQAAQAAVDAGLAAAAKHYEKGRQETPLQAALVSISPQTGGILAYLGGRRYEQSQFDRVSQAARQVGSTFKPVVYAAAFEAHRASPATFLEDEELTVEMGRQTWTPKNDDGELHGWVTARTALEHSYNLATARLALQVGVPPIVELAHAMGITARMDPFPAVALGSTAVSPLELATLYGTLAAGGVRPAVHGLTAALDRHGASVPGAPLPAPERALSPQTDFLVTVLLRGVLEHGTAAGGAAQIKGDLAGKTGTTNDRRDSWFAGYGVPRATVVWVGYDDNSSTRLSGARAALPIWSRFTAAVAPPGGYGTVPQPPGIRTALIDPTTGLLATEYCPEVMTEFFRQGEVPSEPCNVHQGFYQEAMAVPGRPGSDSEPAAAPALLPRPKPAEPPHPRPHPFRRWLRRIFGGRDDEPPSLPGAPSQPSNPSERPPGSSSAGSSSNGGRGDREDAAEIDAPPPAPLPLVPP